jgi:hypothetical protein
MYGTWLPRTLILLALATQIWAGDPDLKLELESSVRTSRVGLETTLRLRIVGPGIDRITERSEDLSPKSPAGSAFVYELKFKPQREGHFTFGPYQVSFDGRELTSNFVSIFVLPPWDGTHGTFFRVDSNDIILGGSLELVMETWSATFAPKHCIFKRDETFTVTPGDSFMFSTASNKDTWVHVRSAWFITPKKPGPFRITRDLFQSFPEEVVPPDITVMVREKDQPTAPDGKEP